MSHMIDFLTDMAVNPKMQEMFWEHPRMIMASVGLTETVQVGFSSQNNASVTSVVIDELLTNELATVVGSCGMADPGPDPSPDPPPPPPPSQQ